MRDIPAIRNDIHGVVADVFKTSAEADFLSRKQIFHFSELLEVMAAQQERLAIESEKTAKENIKLQTKVVNLTRALFWLTLALTFVAAIQVYFLFINCP